MPIAAGTPRSARVWVTVPTTLPTDGGGELPRIDSRPRAAEKTASTATPRPNHLICFLKTGPPDRYRKGSEAAAARYSSPTTGPETRGSSSLANPRLARGLTGRPTGSCGSGLATTSATARAPKRTRTAASHRHRGDGSLPSGKVSTTKARSPLATAESAPDASSSQAANPRPGSAAYRYRTRLVPKRLIP